MHAVSTSTHLPFARQLAAAPHRLLFLVGATNVLLAMAWWTLWLVDARFGWVQMRPAPHYAGWMHAIVMQYHVLSPFIFGFLLTVFPRWMGQAALTRWHYVPVGLGLLGGQALTLAGLLGAPHLLHVGALFTLGGWGAGLAILLQRVWQDGGRTWHAVSCSVALGFGLAGLLCYVLALHLPEPRWIFAAIKLGSFGLLLPMYATVAHRMFPFFAGNVVPGYRAWRPLPWLAVFWSLTLAHLGLELAHAHAWLWLADAPLAVLAAHWLWRNGAWRGAPPLLRVLFAGFAWLPLAFALYALQSAWFAWHDVFILGRAPAHALFIGFFGSLLVAMVTRVTQGHSGRPLQLGGVAAFAFVAIQLVTALRIGADLAADGLAWQVLSGSGWLLAFLPWVLRSGWIYLTPRADGQAG